MVAPMAAVSVETWVDYWVAWLDMMLVERMVVEKVG